MLEHVGLDVILIFCISRDENTFRKQKEVKKIVHVISEQSCYYSCTEYSIGCMLSSFQSHLATKKIVLASSSPRRKELLELMGLSFECIPSTFPEDLVRFPNVSEVNDGHE